MPAAGCGDSCAGARMDGMSRMLGASSVWGAAGAAGSASDCCTLPTIASSASMFGRSFALVASAGGGATWWEDNWP